MQLCSQLIYDLISPIDKIQGYKKQIIPSNLEAKLLLTFPIILNSAGLEVLAPPPKKKESIHQRKQQCFH